MKLLFAKKSNILKGHGIVLWIELCWMSGYLRSGFILLLTNYVVLAKVSLSSKLPHLESDWHNDFCCLFHF